MRNPASSILSSEHNLRPLASFERVEVDTEVWLIVSVWEGDVCVNVVQASKVFMWTINEHIHRYLIMALSIEFALTSSNAGCFCIFKPSLSIHGVRKMSWGQLQWPYHSYRIQWNTLAVQAWDRCDAVCSWPYWVVAHRESFPKVGMVGGRSASQKESGVGPISWQIQRQYADAVLFGPIRDWTYSSNILNAGCMELCCWVSVRIEHSLFDRLSCRKCLEFWVNVCFQHELSSLEIQSQLVLGLDLDIGPSIHCNVGGILGIQGEILLKVTKPFEIHAWLNCN